MLDYVACPRPTARLLELLELLQSQPVVDRPARSPTASAMDARTVRRYIDALRDLGIPVEGQRGVGGGYAMRPGFRLPPLMLGEDEAVAVALGVVAAAGWAWPARRARPPRRSPRCTGRCPRRCAAGWRRSRARSS